MTAPIQVIAHRGDPFRQRENTLRSFTSAIEAGADAVELDVRLTRDGQPVVLHDASPERFWGRREAVAELSLDAVTEISGGEIPTLRQALAATFPVRTLIDFPEADPGTAHAVHEAVRADGSGERVYYCGDPAALRALRAVDPEAEIALTWKRPTPIRRSLLETLRPAWLNYRFGLLSPRVVAHAHDLGYRVSAWTVDSPQVTRRLVRLGVDAITTNRVGALRSHLDRASDTATPPS